MATAVDIELLPKQHEFCAAQEPEVMLSGAFGSGKTRVLDYKLLMHAVIPGNLVALCRKTLADLKQTTLRTLLREEGDLPPVLPPGTYSHYKQDHIISIRGGGEIYYFGFDRPQKAASLNLGCVAVDEGIELDEEEYVMLLGRLRRLVDPHRQIFTATNPGPPGHFLHERFFGNRPNCKLIETNSLENPYLPESFFATLRGFTGTDRDRYVLGKWSAYEGLVHGVFDRQTHVQRMDTHNRRILAAIDEGFTNPAVCLVGGADSDGRIHVFREFYRAGVPPREFVAEVAKIKEQTHFRMAHVDPSAAGLRADLRGAGVPCASADNDVLQGIRAVNKAFAVAPDGQPRLTISPQCKETIREIGGYCWRKGKDEPVKENDHGCDTLRYLVRGFGDYGLDKAGANKYLREDRSKLKKPGPRKRRGDKFRGIV